ncbi:MAG TPA: DNA-3-methyladenine glycosylase [Nitrososphaeraceae archaeon]
MTYPDLEFYSRNTEHVAKDLVGKILVRLYDDGTRRVQRLSGIICETEAYGSKNDPASHAYKGVTDRNSIMFSGVGKAYVYFIYGMHHCVNVTAHSPSSDAGAVLIRSLIPSEGLYTMMRLSNIESKLKITNGPGRLTKALDINRSHNGLNLSDKKSVLQIENGIRPKQIVATTRIGISKAKKKYWRFLLIND